jgi:hypothetical protein
MYYKTTDGMKYLTAAAAVIMITSLVSFVPCLKLTVRAIISIYIPICTAGLFHMP